MGGYISEPTGCTPTVGEMVEVSVKRPALKHSIEMIQSSFAGQNMRIFFSEMWTVLFIALAALSMCTSCDTLKFNILKVE